MGLTGVQAQIDYIMEVRDTEPEAPVQSLDVGNRRIGSNFRRISRNTVVRGCQSSKAARS
jgi:hypothetical protein